MKKQIKIIIAASVAVVILVALIVVVSVLPNGSDTENTESEYVDTTVSLLERTPSEIQSVKVKNEYGEFTILSKTPTTVSKNEETGEETTTTEATIYTLVGFEDMVLQSGQPDSVANDAAAVKALDTIIDPNKDSEDSSTNSSVSYNKADFGLEDPVAVCTVIFNDGETHTIYVGNNVAGDIGTYFMFDDREEIFVGEVEAFDGFMLNILSLFDKNITTTAQTSEDAVVKNVVLSGTAFENEIEFQATNDETSSVSYELVSPIKTAANNVTTTTVANSVLNLIASEVVYVNPDDKVLDEYGLLNPYSKIAVTYTTKKIVLSSSEPDDENNCYVFSEDNNIIYKISSDKLPWVTVKYSDFMPDTVISPYLSKVDKVMVDINGEKYEFNVKTTTEVEDNVQKETTVVTIGDETLDTTNFRVYFSNITSIPYKGDVEGESKGDSLITVTISYSTEKADDIISYYATDSATKVNVKYQGVDTTYNFVSYVNKIIEDTSKMAENGTIDAVV